MIEVARGVGGHFSDRVDNRHANTSVDAGVEKLIALKRCLTVVLENICHYRWGISPASEQVVLDSLSRYSGSPRIFDVYGNFPNVRALMYRSDISSLAIRKCLYGGSAITLLVAMHGMAFATEVGQLSFTAFAPTLGTCELNELGFMSMPMVKKFKGTIKTEKRGPLCTVSIAKQVFNKLYQYCALAFVEVAPSADYVCGVTHFDKGAVEFSYGFKYGEGEPPMCSFVCPRAKP